MQKLTFVVFLFVYIFFTEQQLNKHLIPDKTYNKLPNLFYVDPFEKCVLDPANVYCIFQLKVLPINNATKLTETWNLIGSIKKDYWFYQHDILNYGICIKNQTENRNSRIIEEYLPNFQSKQLAIKILNVECRHYKNKIVLTSTYDRILLSAFLLWFYLIFKSTVADQSSLSAYLKPFSLRNNLNLLKKLWNVSDKFKAIQSLRFFTTVLVVTCHTCMSYSSSFLENPKYFEEFCIKPFKRHLVTLFSFLVTIFFLLSGWLCAYNSFQIFDKIHSSLTFWRFFSTNAINRYLRLFPHMLCTVAFLLSSTFKYYVQGPVDYVYMMKEIENCRNNFWTNSLFIHNQYKSDKMCNPVSWYLAADFQLYLFSTVLLYFLYKLAHKQRIIILLFLIFGGVLVQGLIIYLNDLDIVFRMCGSKFNMDSIDNFEIHALYMKTNVNFSAYMLGLLFGYAFYFFQDKTLSEKTLSNLINIFTLLPIATVILASHQYPKYVAPVIGGIIKPLFAFGIGCGVFALLKGYKGIVSKVFEFKLFVFLGNLTYCTYMFHQVIVFKRMMITEKMLTVSDIILIRSAFLDVVQSFFVAFLCYISFELICDQFQSALVPKLSRKN